jgi:iron complex outermembrane receptor protein
MKTSNRFILFKFLLTLFLVISMALVSGTVIGQESKSDTDEGEFYLEEIVVTGSRIIKRDYESNSPIVTIESAQFEMQTGLNIESYLNQLPQYNPAASPVTTQGDVQITPTNSVGIASISLRGFGPNRSLTLVDGKRPVPVNALMVTDVNGIPSSLIERVETITGGASAVYGADAVGGVTNFILRKDFEGFEFDGQYGWTEAGDGEESRVSALFGTNFADGRGNITMGVGRYERKKALERDRDWYQAMYNDPYAAGYFVFLQGVNAYSCDPNCPTWGVAKALLGGGANPSFWLADFPFVDNTKEMPTYVDINFNPDGTTWTAGFPFQTALGQSRSQIIKGAGQFFNAKALDSGDITSSTVIDGIKYHNLQAYASAPQERYSIYAKGHYDLTDKLSVNTSARFAESRTRTLLFGTSVISGWETSIPYDPTTDSPVAVPTTAGGTVNYQDPAVQAAIAADPAAWIAANPNPGFIATGQTGAMHPVPAELAILLNSRQTHTYCEQGTIGCNLPTMASYVVPVVTGDPRIGTAVPNTGPTGRWQPQWNPEFSLPPRNTYNTISSWQIEAGVDYELPFRDWTSEVYYSYAESATYNEAGGNLSLARYRALTNQLDYGRGATGTGNIQYYDPVSGDIIDTIRPAFGVGDFTCTSGFYDTFFGGDAPLSADCYNAINAVLQTRTEISQEIVEVNLQGGVFNLPAGELRTAVGYQRRDTTGKFNPDILQSSDSFMDQVVGVYPTGYMRAKTLVNDYYIETLVPILSDLPFIKKFELELGARKSDYEGEGQQADSYDPARQDASEWTYKTLASWKSTDWLRMRGGYNRATRAPNLGELFLNVQEVFGGGGIFGDPCNIRSNSPYGAGGTTLATDPAIGFGEPDPPPLAAGQTQIGADNTCLVCEAMMGTAGANYFYRGGNDVTAATGGGFAWVLQQGNPALKPETADTWTAGFVMSSPLESAWLSGMSLSFDWYKIDVQDAIMLRSVSYSEYLCFGSNLGATTALTAAEAAALAASPACQALPRDQRNGAALSAKVAYDNLGTIETSGFDVMFNWFVNLEGVGLHVPGNLAFSLQGTFLDYYNTKQSPADFDLLIDWKGSLGPTMPGTQGGAYDYRLFGTLTYDNVRRPWSVSMRWRHLPSVYTAGYASQQAIIANNASVASGGPGLLLSYTPSTEIESDSYNAFDLSGTWDINETFQLRLGITNLFDTAPVTVGATRGHPPGTSLAVCNGAPGCQDPTSVSLPSTGGGLAPFNGGYYDTIGRRFFLGLKARF